MRPVRLPEQQRLTSVAIIPARYQSTRLPGKPLLDLEGIPTIARVYDRVAATLARERGACTRYGEIFFRVPKVAAATGYAPQIANEVQPKRGEPCGLRFSA